MRLSQTLQTRVLTAKAITGTTVTTSGDIVSSGTIAGNLNVDSADIITISRDNLALVLVSLMIVVGIISIGQPVNF